jgi:hypothetical protein
LSTKNLNRAATGAHPGCIVPKQMPKQQFQIAAFTALMCGAVGLVAQNGGPDYPHAFPRLGTKQLFENDRVTVWEVNWLRNVPQPTHRHRYDMAGVYLRYGFINVTTPEGKVTPSRPFEVPRPYFQLAGITHKEEAVGGPDDPERLAIMVDLKEPAATKAVTRSEMDPAFPREGAKDVLDNARVRMWDYTFDVKKPTGMHIHERDSVEVFVTEGTLRFKTADGQEETKTFAAKDARFVPRAHVDAEEVVSGSPRVITIELK